jgi:hypothetical protein
VHVPYHKLIIVAATCELLTIERPFKATDLLLVAGVSMSYAIFGSEVPAENHAIPGSCADGGSIPRHSTHSA